MGTALCIRRRSTVGGGKGTQERTIGEFYKTWQVAGGEIRAKNDRQEAKDDGGGQDIARTQVSPPKPKPKSTPPTRPQRHYTCNHDPLLPPKGKEMRKSVTTIPSSPPKAKK